MNDTPLAGTRVTIKAGTKTPKRTYEDETPGRILAEQRTTFGAPIFRVQMDTEEDYFFWEELVVDASA